MPADLLAHLFSAAIRASGLGLAAYLGLLLFRIRSSPARHGAWTLVLIGMLLQIPLGFIAPPVVFMVLPVSSAPVRLRVVESPRTPVPVLERIALATRSESRVEGVRWSGTLAGVYLAVSLMLFTRMALGFRGLRRILRDARPVPSVGPGVVESSLLSAPGSAGCFRARILLPLAWRDWDTEQLRAVLAHEKAHIRRQDWLIRVASHVNVCIFWFHPLAWWMERDISRLAEEAADDAALREIEDREGYAATLLDIAQAAAMDGRGVNWRVISMATGSRVVRRVNRILDRRLPVPKPFGQAARAGLLASGLPLIYLSAAVNLGPIHRAVTTSRATAERKPTAMLIAQATPKEPLAPAQPLTPPPARGNDEPITMCILIDNSGDMREKLAEVKMAALALVNASQPRDQVCILNFNDEMFNGLPNGKDFTSDIKEMEEALLSIDTRGGTAMRDAIWGAVDQVAQNARNERKAVVLVTEGDDTSSAITQEQLLGKLNASGVRIYGIGLLGKIERNEAGARRGLRELVEASGGLDYYPTDLAEVERVSPEIANEIRKR